MAAPDAIEPPLAALPLPPRNPLPYWQRRKAVRSHHTGVELLRDAGGPISLITLGPKWLIPPILLVTSPQGIRDICHVRDGSIDKASPTNSELRRLLGGNLFVFPHGEWLARRRTLQPVFTPQRVRQFSGHLAEAAEIACAAWREGTEIELDAQCLNVTLRALGRSVFGLDLGERSDAIAMAMRAATSYAVRRGLAPLRAPKWLPTPARRRARSAAATLQNLAAEILQACHADPTRDAPLVQSLIAATDPETGRPLSDAEIVDELIIFLLGGHHTTATTLAYALWALGRDLGVQDRVAAEAAQIDDRPLAPDDVVRLGFTSQVLQEALRLCPPAPTGTRVATRDVEIAGFRVEAGTVLAFGRRSVQRDPALWEEPLKFDPDRFGPACASGRERWQYLPFGGGPRSCIGEHFAMLEATLALATIVRKFEIRSMQDEFPLTVSMTIAAAGPIRARVRPR